MIVAVTTVLNEVGILDSTCRHLLAQGVDRIVISDGGSTDGTRDIICQLPHTTLLTQRGPLHQDVEMTYLAKYAASVFKADWIIPFDADEYWCGVGVLRDLPATVGKVFAPVYHHVDLDRHWPAPKLPKVAFRPTAAMHIEWGNHNVRGIPGDAIATDTFCVRELQYRDYDHFLTKIERARIWQESANFPEEYGVHMRRLVAMTDDERKAEWVRMVNQPCVYDPIPVRAT